MANVRAEANILLIGQREIGPASLSRNKVLGAWQRVAFSIDEVAESAS